MRGKRVIDQRAHPFQNEKRAALFFGMFYSLGINPEYKALCQSIDYKDPCSDWLSSNDQV